MTSAPIHLTCRLAGSSQSHSDMAISACRGIQHALVAMSLLLGVTTASATAIIEWTAQSPAGTSAKLGCAESRQERRAMAIDASGNTYVAGCIQSSGVSGFLTLKFSATGALLWQRAHQAAGNLVDLGHVLLLDGTGNIIVSGLSARSVAGTTAVFTTTLKYNNQGALLWSAEHPSAEALPATAVDAAGNVFVASATPRGAGGLDYRLVKYASSGAQQWTRDYAGSANGDDAATAVAVTPAGDVLVTGATTTAPDKLAFTTIKYNSQGSLLWTQSFPNGIRSDLARSIAVDSAGDIVVAGTSSGSGTDRNMVAIKYSPTGSELWTRRFDAFAGLEDDSVYDMVLDNQNNAVIVGRSSSVTGWDYTTLKLSPAGAVAWVRHYDNIRPGATSGVFDGAQAVVVDAARNIYVTGESQSVLTFTGREFATIKYNADGAQQWVHRFHSTSSTASYGGAIALAADGGILVAGNETGSVPFITVMKLREDTDRIFANGFDG